MALHALRSPGSQSFPDIGHMAMRLKQECICSARPLKASAISSISRAARQESNRQCEKFSAPVWRTPTNPLCMGSAVIDEQRQSIAQAGNDAKQYVRTMRSTRMPDFLCGGTRRVRCAIHVWHKMRGAIFPQVGAAGPLLHVAAPRRVLWGLHLI